ncbi:MAG TPA: DUF4058 family protein, partial [Gemmataceae bacterium]|nr:DUF4058 family protein [Gemmataceae bacterium]
MASPFAGMDPYIKGCGLWEDFHSKLIGEIERTLSALVPERYVVRTGERSYVALAVDEDVEQPSILPDVVIASENPRSGPVLMQAVVKAEYRELFLEIHQGGPEHKLITGIEVLSPSNKRPNTRGWRLYHRKRLAFLTGHANFVELDLLRRGRRMPMVGTWPDSPYYLLVCRKKEAPRCTVWPAHYTKRLPLVPIPLAPPDADIP